MSKIMKSKTFDWKEKLACFEFKGKKTMGKTHRLKRD
jgi:hypothetical protein